jgi:hypothetical protein
MLIIIAEVWFSEYISSSRERLSANMFEFSRYVMQDRQHIGGDRILGRTYLYMTIVTF